MSCEPTTSVAYAQKRSAVDMMAAASIGAAAGTASFAASPISMGVQPTSCIETGSSTGSHIAFWIDWRVSRIAAWLAIISVTFSPEP